MTLKTGYVAIVGRPNVGKSTLINAILGERLSIVTAKPQTTRHKITGILNEPDSQIIFLDTPGYHKSHKALNQTMNEIVDSVLHDADVICLMVSATDKDLNVEEGLFERTGPDKTIVVLNKADKIGRNQYEAIATKFREQWHVKELVIMSALKNEGVRTLIQSIKERLPEGERFYPEDIYTEHSVRFIASELIREEVFLKLSQELPYSTAVVIEEFKDATQTNPITVVHATIVVERDSQKAIVIGKGGRQIKEIGKAARIKIEELVGGKVFLDLNVRVEQDWSKDRKLVEKLGY